VPGHHHVDVSCTFYPRRNSHSNHILLLLTSSPKIRYMREDSIHKVHHAIVRTVAAVDRRSSFRRSAQTIKRIDEVESKFISCAAVRSTSFVDLHIISARWRTGSSVRESQTVLLEDQSQAPLARAIWQERPMSRCSTTLIWSVDPGRSDGIPEMPSSAMGFSDILRHKTSFLQVAKHC
jgi:hypothetical protein